MAGTGLSHIRKKPSELLFIVIAHLFITLFALSILLPLMYIVQITFSTTGDAQFRIYPKGFTLDHYKFVITRGLIIRPLLNSLYLTAVSTSVSLGLTVLLAYPLSRRELIGRRTFNFLLILPMMISLGFLPKFLLIKQLGLIDTYTAIVFASAISAYNTIIMRNYFQHLPDSVIDSARIDGCKETRILLQIIIPMSKPVIATITLFYMMGMWNKYFDIILYINNPLKHTLQVILRSMIMGEDRIRDSSGEAAQFAENIRYTTIVVAIIPVMIVYPFLQKYFAKGIILGSVKG
jgi:putative aldouronate transport system permease protein